jgi:nucleoside-diphosphate-sugar epimerase
MSKLLITGSSGFIGGRLVHSLSGHYDVYAPVRTGKTILLEDSSPSVISYDDIPSLSGESFQALIHCASLTPANSSNQDIIYEQNLSLTESIRSAIHILKPKLFIFCSSVSVYGDIYGGKLNLESPYNNPSIYGKTKLLAENIFSKACDEVGVKCIILRLPGVVGFGSHGNIISKIVEHFCSKLDTPLSLKNPDSLFNNIVPIPLLIDFIDMLMTKSFDESQSFITIPSASEPIPFHDVVDRISQLFNSTPSQNIIWSQSDNRSFTINCDDVFARGYKQVSTLESLSLLKLDIHRFIS